MQVEQSQTMDEKHLELMPSFVWTCILHLCRLDIWRQPRPLNIIDMFGGIIRGWAALILIIFKSSKISPKNGFTKKHFNNKFFMAIYNPVDYFRIRKCENISDQDCFPKISDRDQGSMHKNRSVSNSEMLVQFGSISALGPSMRSVDLSIKFWLSDHFVDRAYRSLTIWYYFEHKEFKISRF